MSTVYIRFTARRLDSPRRAPLLERLIARASTPTQGADWRFEAFGVIAPVGTPMPPVAAMALHAASGRNVGSSPDAAAQAVTGAATQAVTDAAAQAAPGAWVCVATPVHLLAGMSSVSLPEDGIVELSADDARLLAVDFNRVFAGAGVGLSVGRAATLLCVFDRTLDVAARDPEGAMGRDVFEFQPVGSDAPRLRRLMTEIEMWLYDHKVNRERAALGRQPVTGLWLWGGGTTNSQMPTVHGWVAGRDPFFAAFGAQMRFPPEASSGVVVCSDYPGSSTWLDTESRWLAPVASGLHSGRIERLELSVAERRFTVTRGRNWRFWRRPKPWWESLFMMDGESHGIQ